RCRPARELLSEPAIESHFPIAVGQALGRHARAHLGLHLRDVVAAPGEEGLEALAFLRGVGVERKVHELHLHAVLLLQPRDARRAEIAPGADVVRETLEYPGLGHVGIASWETSASQPRMMR